MPVSEMVERSYSLVGPESRRAVERGLAEADWYTPPVDRAELRKLLHRRDGPSAIHCLLYFGLLLAAGVWAYRWWPSAWAVVPFLLYGILYASASDARWHEASHGTPFRTDALNNALYEVASFMVLRESIPWRWSHTRHHSDTIIVGRDPEIAVPRPPRVRAMILKMFNAQAFRRYVRNVFLHCLGRVTAEEAAYIPRSEYPRVFFRARIYAGIYLLLFAGCWIWRSWLPLLYVLGPNLYGAWLMPIYGYSQHAGLAEDVLDHRLNTRSIRMHAIHRFLYWNMNYHLEHHLFPLVPWYNLPRLHALVKDDCPDPYPSLWAAYREIIPAVLRQMREPGYHVRRRIPESARPSITRAAVLSVTEPAAGRVEDGWVEVCRTDAIEPDEVVRFDHAARTFAIYRLGEDDYHATDGMCTHGNTHLSGGLVKGTEIECPKHNGRFDIIDGRPLRPPVCVGLRTYAVRIRDGSVWLNPGRVHGGAQQTHTLRVGSNDLVATFIRELVLAPAEGGALPAYRPGQYMQLDIPAYETIRFSEMSVGAPFDAAWRTHGLFDLRASNPVECRRNYSIATCPSETGTLRFNVRLALPPPGPACSAGAGSSYVHHLKPGDGVTAVGPFGDFLIRESGREMVYIGGGAGMAPMRSHLVHLLRVVKTKRRISYWYGARSRQDLFYADEFAALADRFPNFSFHATLSDPQPGDAWPGSVGFIHAVLRREYLSGHRRPKSIEYYLCGPPLMIQAARGMLEADFGVASARIAFDEF